MRAGVVLVFDGLDANGEDFIDEVRRPRGGTMMQDKGAAVAH